MDPSSLKRLKRQMFLLFPLVFIFLAIMLIASAGTLRYWEAWLFCAVTMFSASLTSLYFLKHSPDLLERRMRFKEKEGAQRLIIRLAGLFFLVGCIVAGFDQRFDWSTVPVMLVIVADVVYLVGHGMVFYTFKANTFAGRTVEVFAGQKLIDTGPYAVVRHPMYAGMIPMFFAMPIALGSWWALLFFIPICIAIIPRIANEEGVLRRELQGYGDYCKRVRYRLLPYVW